MCLHVLVFDDSVSHYCLGPNSPNCIGLDEGRLECISTNNTNIAHFPMPLLLSGILCFVKLDTFSHPLHLEML